VLLVNNPLGSVGQPPRFLRLVHTPKTCVLPHAIEPFNRIRWAVRWLAIFDPLATLLDQMFVVCGMREAGRNRNSRRDVSGSDGTQGATSLRGSNRRFVL